MSKRKIRNLATKILAAVIAVSLVVDSSIVGYASNHVLTSQGIELETEIENSEEVTEDIDEKITTSEDNLDGEESEEESVSEEDPTETESQEMISDEEMTTSGDEEDTTSWETIEEQESEVISTENPEEETETEFFSEDISIKNFSETMDGFVIEDGVLTSYTGNETDIVIPDGVTEIADRVFLSKTFIKTVIFPTSLKKIGEFAFCGCTGLVNITLNEGLENIGDDAFYGASFGKLNEKKQTVDGTLTIPSTVTYIGYEAFCNAINLEEVIFADGGNATIEFGVKEGNNSMFRACSKLKKVTLAQRIKDVPPYAFQNCSALEEVTFGTVTETIGKLAFNKCPSLKELDCPTTLRKVGDYAFSDCKLISTKLNEGLETIGEGAFYGTDFGGKNEQGKMVYGELTIPSTVTYIGNVAFCSSTYLGEVLFTDEGDREIEFGLKDGKSSMFMACPNLRKVTLPQRVKTVPGAAFQNCPLLTTVILGDAVESIGEIAFNKCSELKELICPGSLLSIGKHAFSDCEGLVTISLNEGLRIIEEGAFYNAGVKGVKNNTRLTYSTLTIPSTVQEIGVHAFFNCQEYETIIFSNGTNSTLEFVGVQGESYAFQNCLNLKTVYLPERLKELKSLTFLNCPKLESLYIPKTVEKIADNFLEYCNASKLVIYGTVGSTAEKYAKENSITFVDESELGVYAKSIQLNCKNLRYVGNESLGEKVRLTATVLPGTAQNRNVIYSSKDNGVATVNSSGVVTIVGYGETDIVVMAEENANVFEVCRVEVLKSWTAQELEAVRQYIVANNDFTLITNMSSNLQDDLPILAGEGITAQWKFPYEIETGTHAYDISLNRNGYESILLKDVLVTGVEIKGIDVNGPGFLQVNSDLQVVVEFLTEGGDISPDDYIVEWESGNTENLIVESSKENTSVATISGLKVNKGTNLTARVYLKKNGVVYSEDKKDLGRTWFEDKKKIVVSKDAIVDEIEVRATQNGDLVTLETLNSLVDLTGSNTYELSASAYSNKKELTGIPLTFKSSNSKVAKVKTDKNGKTILSVLTKGTCLITVKAAKNGGYTTSFRVTVKSDSPRLVQKTITVNRYRLDAYSYVTIMPSDGYSIKQDSLSIVNAKNKEETDFEISKVSGYTYKISVKQGVNIKKGNYSVKILAKTSLNENHIHELPLKIKVTEEKPKVTIRQTAIVPYVKDSYGVVEIITPETICDMSYTSSAGIGKARLIQKEADVLNATITIKADNVDSTNYKKVANKGTLIVRFEGYREEASYKKNINLSVNSKLPVIKATPQSSTLYPQTLADTTKITLYNNSNKEEVTSINGYGVEVNTLSKYIYTSNDYNKAPAIQALEGAKKGKLNFTVTNSKWIDGVSVKASCNLKIAKTPVLSFSKSSLNLNTAYTMEQYDAVSVSAYVKGFEDISYASEKTEIVGKNKKAQKALDDGALLIVMEDGQIKAGITGNGYFTKSETLSYQVTAYSEKNMPVRGTLHIKIYPAKNKVTVSYKMSGNINLLDRENTCIVAKPTIKNYTASVTGVELYGANSGKFRAELADGAIAIYAVNGKAIKANTKYSLNAYVTLDSGVLLTTKISVTPKQKNPKLTQNSKSIVLFESARGLEYGADIVIELATNYVGKIKNIGMVSESNTFAYSEGKIYVKDTAVFQTGKTYTVKLAVTYEDQATNVKPSYVNVKIEYRK